MLIDRVTNDVANLLQGDQKTVTDIEISRSGRAVEKIAHVEEGGSNRHELLFVVVRSVESRPESLHALR